MQNNKTTQLQSYPLSRGQSALWFHYKLAPTNVAYHLAAAVAVPDDTNLEALKQSLQKLADRHPMLRTLFTIEQGEPVQRVQPAIEISYHLQDASMWQPDQMDEFIKEKTYHPFDLEKGPTWRVTVILNAPLFVDDEKKEIIRQPLILFIFHHIVADLWSSAIIMSEVAAIYREETDGIPASLRTLHKTYQDHVIQEKEKLEGKQGEAAWNYWRKNLSGELPTLNLSTSLPRPTELTGQGAVHFFHLNRERTHKLRNLAEQQKVPFYTVLFAAYQALLYRYTGQKDILVGFPKAGRNLSTIRVVGYFVNQMIVRTAFSDEMNFLELLNKVHQSIEEGSHYDWYPFAELVQNLQPNRELSRSPLIQTVFSWQQAPPIIPKKNAGPFMLGQGSQQIDLEGLSIRSVHIAHRVAPFELMMMAAETDDEIIISLEYATDLYDRDTITRLAQSYCTLLEDITHDPQKPVSLLQTLPESEQELLINQWNDTESDYPDSLCLHELFEKQVQRSPHALAVVLGKEILTYKELNEKANQLAYLLREKGVGKNGIAGIYLESSVLMVVAILGVLKAGGAYLPLDPGFPNQRLDFVIEETKPILMITSQKLHTTMPDFQDTVICLDSELNKQNSKKHSNLILINDPDQLAYVIYTSGSSGRPKGVLLSHRGVVNLLADFQRRQPIQPGEQCSWWTSPSFDVSVYEIFSPLLVGGILHIIPEKIRLMASKLFTWMVENQIHSAYLPPFLLEDFAKWIKSNPKTPYLRRLLVGVEPISDRLLRTICNQIPGLCLLNGYGPTETTICSTLYQVDPAAPHSGNTPIGKPVANTKIYLLNENLQVVPQGMPGELFIGGAGVSSGYIHQPELTGERFIPSPFIKGETLYRTGDVARYLPDGNLLFMGRADSQVKFHGMRIELGEIEMVLSQHPEVKQAAVLLLNHPQSHAKQLVAFIVPKIEKSILPTTLAQFMSQQLPRSMVPTAFVPLESFPLTPSAKVDRQALLNMDYVLPTQNVSLDAPLSEKEQIFVSIWQKVLGIDKVQVEDNFFELGGDSIMSILVVIHAEEAGLKINPQHIFQASTIKQLAALAERVEPSHNPPQLKEDSGQLYFTPIQHWFFEQDFTNPHHWNQSILFVTEKSLQMYHLRAAAAVVINQHDVFRMRYYPGKSGWRSEILDKVEVPCDVFDFSNLPPLQQEDALKKQIEIQQQSLNITTGPLIRLVYFNVGKDRPGRLLIIVHHLAIDTVSWHILLPDLQKAYLQSEKGNPVTGSPTTTSYKAWGQQLKTYANSPQFLKETNFWKKTLAMDTPSLPIDFDLTDQSLSDLNKESTARQVTRSFTEEETRVLLREAPAAFGADILDFLLTAMARAFKNCTGEDTLAIDLEAHGRENMVKGIQLTHSVGWFTALYPIYLSLPGNPDQGEAIKLIKEQLRLIPLHGVGYGIFRYLSPIAKKDDRLEQLATPGIRFNYLGQLPENDSESNLLGFASEAAEFQRSAANHRSHLIEIDALIHQGKLQVNWTYSDRLHKKITIDRFATFFLNELRSLITYAQNPKIWGYTPSDFPDIKRTQSDLDILVDAASFVQTSPHKRNLEAIYPLSSMQRSMVLPTLFTPESDVYVQQIIFTFLGTLDMPAFQKAWQFMLNRHAILRTSFIWKGAKDLVQVVHKHLPLEIELQDWENIPPLKQTERFDKRIQVERKRGFDLSSPPLFRLFVLRLSEGVYRILFTHHHALLDGWSLPILFKELFTAYEGFTQHKEISLPPVKPYREYISWLQSQDLSKAEAFWQNALSGISKTTWLPVRETSSPGVDKLRTAELKKNLSVHTTSKLKTFARKQQLTLGTIMQCAWAILLSRTFQRDEILFGITIAGRPYELKGVESMVGLFINTLPLKITVPPNILLFEWLPQIQKTALNIQQYGYTPLSKIPGWIGMPHNTFLFDSILVFENYPAFHEMLESFDRLAIRDIRSLEKTTFPLTVAITPGEKINLRILYDLGRFKANFAQQLIDELIQILEIIATGSNQPLLNILSFNEPDFHPQLRDGAPPNEVQLKNQTGGVAEKEITHQNTRFDKTNKSLERYLSQLWGELLNIKDVKRYDNFFELGGDSLSGAICVSQLQDALNEPVSLTAIFEAPTVFALSNYLIQHHPKGVSAFLGIEINYSEKAERPKLPTSLVPIQPKGNKTPLFCIHPAGGVVFPYYTLAAYLGKEQPVYGIQDPQLYDPEQGSKSIETMAAQYVEVLKTIQPEGPYNLLGWSVGGVVAYEIAQQLTKQGQLVNNLIMLDTNAPHLSNGHHSETSIVENLKQVKEWGLSIPNQIQKKWFAIDPILNYVRSGLFLLSSYGNRKNGSGQRKPKLKDLLGWAVLDTWRTRLLQEAEIAQTVSQEESLLLIKMPAVRRILKLIRTHQQMVQQYAAQPYRGNITLFRAVDFDSDGNDKQVSALGWQKLAEGQITVHPIQANHVAFLVKPTVVTLAQELSKCLDQNTVQSQKINYLTET
ncbi:MAG: hypothetical protein CL609_03295 [Anaerolineaceae bacterium]|nr:hypothetical protein [Anaerolineaceae bacterium]